jgi:hypothetical protein
MKIGRRFQRAGHQQAASARPADRGAISAAIFPAFDDFARPAAVPADLAYVAAGIDFLSSRNNRIDDWAGGRA